MANDTYPNKPLQPWIPKSQRNSGTQLDEGCGEIEQASASATMSMDEVFQSLGTEKGEITMPRIEVNASHHDDWLAHFFTPRETRQGYHLRNLSEWSSCSETLDSIGLRRQGSAR